MYKISKQFTFSASHELAQMPGGHPCKRVHGHNYVVEVELSSIHLDDYGMILDYHELSKFKNYLDTAFDHRHLNDVLDGYPTAENLARHFFLWCRQRWSQVSAIRVSETPKTWAEYRDET